MADALGAARIAGRFDRALMARMADGLAAAIAVSLPWSTSATGILVAAWLIVALPTLDLGALRRTVLCPAGGLPVLLWLAAVVGMLWADVSLAERLGGLGSFHKLLVLPLLLAHFRGSRNGHWAINGFLISCTVLLLASFLHVMGVLPLKRGDIGVPVKDYITQSGEFLICIFGLAYAACEAVRVRRFLPAVAMTLLALLFLANITFVTTGRTALVVLPVLLLLLGLRQFGWKGVLGALIAGIVLGAALWASSPYLRERVGGISTEITLYETANQHTSAGQRLEFWKKSLRFVADAPVFGHGTGSINELFRRAAVGDSGPAAIKSHNPHQQTLAVAIQLGLVGVLVMFAMWAAHAWLFRGPGLVNWLGLVIVVQNIVGSLFNSHLFDFTQGWIYVVGVGVIGGMALKDAPPSPAPPGRAGA
jgi:O-antigen ligase